MICPSCGDQTPDDAKFCSSCGRTITQEQSTAERMASNQDTAPQPPVKKKMALWKKIGIGLFLLMACGLGFGFFLTAELVDPIDRQIEALTKGDIKTAYDQTSIGFKDGTTQEEFAAWIKRHPVFTNVKERTFTKRSRKKGTGRVEGTLTAKSGQVLPVAYKLVEENGTWKIQSIKINP